MTDETGDWIEQLQEETRGGRPERILAALRSRCPEVLDRVALMDVAEIAAAAEVVTFLDIADFLDGVPFDG